MKTITMAIMILASVKSMLWQDPFSLRELQMILMFRTMMARRGRILSTPSQITLIEMCTSKLGDVDAPLQVVSKTIMDNIGTAFNMVPKQETFAQPQNPREVHDVILKEVTFFG